ncbi:Uncharacterised protein [Vibrio cholerae]|nr:Uncharacterised protein [Vibrio cholerae]CSA86899.1 Uncharacterised protein [Vibrio cholerae]CSC48421.1 Uncharacterised protein [Vibrio cholerae]CSD43047.1 Uncharacterised protein [Vibrio cholerae]CSI69368.1 Uncharacterised protein [Vibrio cholerae]
MALPLFRFLLLQLPQSVLHESHVEHLQQFHGVTVDAALSRSEASLYPWPSQERQPHLYAGGMG